MESLKHRWKNIPHPVRKPLVFIIGFLFILAAAATGWLPGPGGIPLFLIGIAILASEFTWAQRIERVVMGLLQPVFRWFRAHKLLGTLIILGLIGLTAWLLYHLYFQ